jgi:N-acylneuraminate cytidylyltransferase
MLGDKPLIAWSILQAKSVKSIDRVLVSTDSIEIAAIAR